MTKPLKYSYALILMVLFGLKTHAQDDEENLKINHEPYVQALTDSSASIVWTTNKDAVAWVELAPDDSTHFYHKERAKFYSGDDGFKNIGTVHKVHLKNLDPDTRYRYRVYSKEVLNHEWVNVDYGQTVATDVFKGKPLEFETFGPTETTNFAVINDIHGRNEVMNTLLNHANLAELDFVVFNGDMANNLSDEDQMFDDFMDTAIKRFKGEKPFFYARGNHETRGPFASEFSNYFPSVSGKLYYLFRHGNAAFIVLDTGEDKPDNDIEYSGIVDMDYYRSQQAEWLKKAVKDPIFKNAKYKIAIGHIPPLGGWHGEQEVFEKFVPILNKAGVQIMLAAHYHRHVIKEEEEGIDFPIIVNSNNNLLKVKLTKDKGVFQVLDQENKRVDKVEVVPE